jgi:hypothetical protein
MGKVGAVRGSSDLLAMERALDMHEAAVIAGCTDFSVRGEDGFGLLCEHGGGDVGILDGEGSTEAAALLEGGKLDEFDAAHFVQETHGAVAEGEVAKAVAAGVVGDAVRVVGADVFEAKAVGEKLGELKDPGQQLGDRVFEVGIAGLTGHLTRHLRVVIAHHGDAGGGRDDDGFCVRELVDEALQEGHGLGLVAGVVVHLAAAGLAWRKVYGVPEALEDAHDGLAGAGEERVVIAGDEE